MQADEHDLLQRDVMEDTLPRIGTQPWQTLYLSDNAHAHRFGVWCALLDEEVAAKAMTHDSWDLTIGDGMPGFSQSWTAGAAVKRPRLEEQPVDRRTRIDQ